MLLFSKSTYNAILFCFITMPWFFVSFSVDAMNWSDKHRAFIVATFIKTNEAVTATKRAFRSHFNRARWSRTSSKRDLAMGYQLQSYWICIKTKSNLGPPAGRPRTTRTPENVAAVRASIQQSPHRSSFKRVILLDFSEEVCEEFFLMVFKWIHSK